MDEQTQQQMMALYEKVKSAQAELNALLRSTTDSENDVGEHVFATPDGEVALRDLFGERDDLIVVHNMGAKCAYCTLWADGFNGVLPHLQNRAAFVVASPDPVDAQQTFAQSRGWNFRMVSDQDGFAEAMGYRNGDMVMPGFSTFRREGDRVRRVGHSPFGPGDQYCGVWHLFEMLDQGTDGWQPKFTYASSGESS